jgi:hypothetical protein
VGAYVIQKSAEVADAEAPLNIIVGFPLNPAMVVSPLTWL